jgi:hypothetical protein
MSSLSDDDERRWHIPLMLGAILAVVVASRFDVTRQLEANLFAFGFPLLATGMAVIPLRESTDALRNAGFTLGGIAAFTAEIRVARAFAIAPPELAAIADCPATAWLLVASVASAAVLQAAAARRGMRTFAGAWFGMAAALAIYLPGHFQPEAERFGQVLAALMLSLIVGGGPGFLAGALLTSFVKTPPRAK